MPVICGSPILPMGPLDVAQERARVWSHEVPRGSLGHWVEVSDGLIQHYQAVMPTTWKRPPAAPRVSLDLMSRRPSALRSQIRSVRLLLRTVHFFDPCLACAVHVFDAEHAGLRTRVTVAPRAEWTAKPESRGGRARSARRPVSLPSSGDRARGLWERRLLSRCRMRGADTA